MSTTPPTPRPDAGADGFSWAVHTAPAPGAIAIVHLRGSVESALAALTGRDDWPPGTARLAAFDEIDEGIAARLDDLTAQLMPHGGPRVVQRLIAKLESLGGRPGGDDPLAAYPEAEDRIEACMLRTLARAASPLAIDLLLDQPRRWRDDARVVDDATRARSRRLDRLVVPPVVVIAGPPNVGKSTLGNALAGRNVSMEADLPGTTRDYVGARIELAGLVVDLYDTPGRRATGDAIERRAIEIAEGLVARADLLVALTDCEHDWPDLPREADLRVASKADLGRRADADLAISATKGSGMDGLVAAMRDRLVPPADVADAGRWLFDRLLER